MTQPRRIVPGQYYMITRRTTQRAFFLRPDPVVTAAYEYCLAEAARRFEQKLIAWDAMSNHHHIIVYDSSGRLPAFIEQLHKMLAKILNAHHARREGLWSSEETCVTHLLTLEDVFDKVAYVLANPAAAHLVDTISHWPGASSWTSMGASPRVVRRPLPYFRKDGRMPATVVLEASAPPSLERETPAEWDARVRHEVARREAVLNKTRLAAGRRVLGRKAVLATNPFDAPTSESPSGTLRPALACKNAARMMEAKAILKEFRDAYRKSLERLLEDNKKAAERLDGSAAPPAAPDRPKLEFPAGTYRLRLTVGVPCKPLHASAA
jgi:putative transposase